MDWRRGIIDFRKRGPETIIQGGLHILLSLGFLIHGFLSGWWNALIDGPLFFSSLLILILCGVFLIRDPTFQISFSTRRWILLGTFFFLLALRFLILEGLLSSFNLILHGVEVLSVFFLFLSILKTIKNWGGGAPLLG